MQQLLYSPIPLCLAIEPINLCNAQCFCCPYTEFAMDKTFTKEKMSKEQITQLIEDWASLLKKHNIRPWDAAILPWRYSDPLLNPNLETVLQLADKHKITISLTTNAISFGKRQCDILQKYIHTLTKMYISVIGFTEQEIWEQMKVKRDKVFQSLEFVRDNYPAISKLMKIAIKNRSQRVPSDSTVQEYRKRTLGKATGKGSWMSNRLGKGDDVWTKPSNWKPSEKSFVNGCGLTPGKILNRLEIMVSGRAALCCDMSYDRNFPKEKWDMGSVFEIGIAGVWENLTKYHKLIYDQEFSKEKLNLICNNCDRAGINSLGWTLDKTIEHQTFRQMKKFPKIKT